MITRDELNRLFGLTRQSAEGKLDAKQSDELGILTGKLEELLEVVRDPIVAEMIRERYLKNRKWFQIAMKWAGSPDAVRKSCARAIAAARRRVEAGETADEAPVAAGDADARKTAEEACGCSGGKKDEGASETAGKPRVRSADTVDVEIAHKTAEKPRVSRVCAVDMETHSDARKTAEKPYTRLAGTREDALKRLRKPCGRRGCSAAERQYAAPSSAENRAEYASAYKTAHKREQPCAECYFAAEIKGCRCSCRAAYKAYRKRVYKQSGACRLCRKQRARKAARRRAEKRAHGCELFVKHAEIYKGGADH